MTRAVNGCEIMKVSTEHTVCIVCVMCVYMCLRERERGWEEEAEREGRRERGWGEGGGTDAEIKESAQKVTFWRRKFARRSRRELSLC